MQKLLHNRYVLYSIFILALLDLLYLGYIEDMSSVSTFVLVGLLISFFSKNMIVILSSAIVFTHVLKLGGFTDVNIQIEDITYSGKEGLADKTESKKEKETDEEEPTDAEESEEPKSKDKTKKSKTDSVLSTKEEFGQDKQVVYTSVEDQSVTDEDKMILAHEKLLEKMNKYKPLLDTLQGISKNIATVKQLSQESSSSKIDDDDE